MTVDIRFPLKNKLFLGLNSVRDTMKAVVDFGLQQLRSIVLKPRLNTWIDQFSTYNHVLNEVKEILFCLLSNRTIQMHLLLG